MSGIVLILWWCCVALLLLTYVGFPLVLGVHGMLFQRSAAVHRYEPTVSLCIAVHNEREHIAAKVGNCLALDYPAGNLEFVFACDGCTDGTEEVVRSFGDNRIRLLSLERGGKNHALNRAAGAARGEVLVFTDVDARIEAGALRTLVAPLGHPSIGGVAGDYRYTGDKRENAGEWFHWGVDRLFKRLQTVAGSPTSASGAFYAIRRELFAPLSAGVSDDFFISTGVITRGYRLLFEPRAVAHGPPATREGEYPRKVRVITKGLQGLWQVRHLLNPLRYGFYSFQLFVHKFLRRFASAPMLLLPLLSLAVWHQGPVYRVTTAALWVFHLCAIAGLLLRNSRTGRCVLLALPFYVDMVSVAALHGFLNAACGKQFPVWRTSRARTAEP